MIINGKTFTGGANIDVEDTERKGDRKSAQYSYTPGT